MKNLKKLSREDLKIVQGVKRACSVAIQGSDGTWVTRTGTCDTYHYGVSGTGSVGYCNTSLGYMPVTSNGGKSRCDD